MKKQALAFMALAAAMSVSAQSAFDGYNLGRQDLKGTARFMGMAGAFGALGGDMTTLSYNPAGIGVYRSSELGATVDLSIQGASMDFGSGKTDVTSTRFLLNNIGYVGTARTNSVLRNFNWGFTYNRVASFNRRYQGMAAGITNSMSNYIAGMANDNGVWLSDLLPAEGYDPYKGYVNYQAPWLAILGYQSNIISPNSDDNENPDFKGLYGDGTSGTSKVQVEERGGIDEYNIAFGGNFGNVLYWGMDFGILDVNYTRRSLYTEYLDDAYVGVDTNQGTRFLRSQADWDLENYYYLSGNGWNYKLGLIFKPIQELRLGFAFHTPTWYSLSEDYGANTSYNYPDTSIRPGSAETNGGYLGYNEFNLRTPWRFMASAAVVAAGRLIVSADVDWTSHQYMHFSDPAYERDGWGFDAEANDPYYYTNQDVKDYYKTSVTFRAGAEFRVTPRFSVRAGYAHVSSPVKEEAKNNDMTIYTAGTDPSYEFDDTTDYVTAGLGYRYGHFYIDAAYVYRHRSSEWHAFTPDPQSPAASGAIAKLDNSNSQVVLSLGFKF